MAYFFLLYCNSFLRHQLKPANKLHPSISNWLKAIRKQPETIQKFLKPPGINLQLTQTHANSPHC